MGNREDTRFDAFLERAVAEAFHHEMDALPQAEALGEQYPSSPEMDRRIRKLIEITDEKKRRRASFKWRRLAVAAAIFLVLAGILLSGREGLYKMTDVLTGSGQNDAMEAAPEEAAGASGASGSDEAADAARQTEEYADTSESGAAADADMAESNAAEDAGGGGLHYPAELPDGFSYISESAAGGVTTTIYADDSGSALTFAQWAAESITLPAGIEVYKETEVAGSAAYLYETKEGEAVLLWNSGGTAFSLMAPLADDLLISVAESVA